MISTQLRTLYHHFKTISTTAKGSLDVFLQYSTGHMSCLFITCFDIFFLTKWISGKYIIICSILMLGKVFCVSDLNHEQGEAKRIELENCVQLD